MNNALIKGFGITALAAAVAACGGSGSGSSSTGTGTFSLGITDAPSSDFDRVEIVITGVAVKPAEGEALEFDFSGNPKQIDLLELQGGKTRPLLEDVEIDAGEYNWVLLELDTDRLFAYDDDAGKQYVLGVPSGKIRLVSGFTINQGGDNQFTIDFDVRKSIVDPQGSNPIGDYFIRPALRLVDNLEVGSITGQVDYALINSTRDENDTDGSLADCGYEGSVYVYEGSDVEPTDLNVNEEGGPLMVVPVTNDESGSLYSYTAAFLTEGDYTVSYSCQLDDNEQDDGLEFDGTQNVTVEAGVQTEAELIDSVQ